MPDDRATSPFDAGWHPDPIGRFELRYHNGDRWTADVSSGGARFVDPLGIAAPDAATNPLATASMVLGIIAVTTAWMPFLVVIGLVTAVVALGLGIAALRRSTPVRAGRGRAV